MKKKFNRLSLVSFILALTVFAFTFALYHYMGPEGSFCNEWREEPVKPFVTLLFGIWGVTFLFSSVISLVIGNIFFSENKKDKE